MPPKIAVIGADGFIGRAVFAAFRQCRPDVLGTSRRVAPNDPTYLDLTAPDIRPLRLAETGHEAALILAADPNVGHCHAHPQASHQLNVTGTLALTDQLVAAGVLPIFTSTDYVFEGSRGNYTEEDPTEPGTAYGRQKLAAEQGILCRTNGDALILRLSKIYNTIKGSNDLLDDMARRLAAGEVVRAAHDQVFNPMHVADLIAVIQFLTTQKLRGTFHVCGDEALPRVAIAREVAKAMRAPEHLIEAISLDDLGIQPPRPKRTSMCNDRLRAVYTKPMTTITEAATQIAVNYA